MFSIIITEIIHNFVSNYIFSTELIILIHSIHYGNNNIPLLYNNIINRYIVVISWTRYLILKNYFIQFYANNF